MIFAKTEKIMLKVWLGFCVFCMLSACSTSPVEEPLGLTSTAVPTVALLTHSRLATPDVQILSADLSPAVEAAQPTPTAIPPTFTATPPTEHLVQPGDTLWALSLAYDVPIAAFQLANDLGETTLLQLGQELHIPAAEDWVGADTFWVVHVVAEGETLSDVAADYTLEMASLREVNGLSDSDALPVGASLILPLDIPVEMARVQPTPIPLPAATATPLAPGESPLLTPEVEATLAVVPQPVPLAAADWPAETFRLLNEARAAEGLPPFLYNETLARAAQLHADDCSQRGSCSHSGSDGSNIKLRVQRIGYTGIGWAECWATSTKSPQGALDYWLGEVPPDDAHRRTLLHTWLTEVGIGVSAAPWDGYYYIIVDLGRP